MADKKVTELPVISALSSDDLLLVIDDPAGTPTSKRATVGQLAAALGFASGGPSDLRLTGTVYEYSRTTAMGHSVPVPWNAANFYTNDAPTVTWTVSAADQVNLEYAIVGKSVFFYYDLKDTSVSAPTISLNIAIPSAITPRAGIFYVNGSLLYDNGVWQPAFAQASSAGIQLFRSTLATLTAAVNTTIVRGMCVWQLP
jgi:hypothetical protein